MKRLMIVLGLALSMNAGASAEEVARGIVYEDVNGNGRRDAGEPGIEGVRVSNGVEIVMTDEGGRYELPVDDDTILFVIKPRGYMTPVDELNLPRFYYIHKPAGSPDDDAIFAGVEPTGPLPESVDFALIERPEADRFKVLLFGDPQVYDTRDLNWYARTAVPAFARAEADFAIALGDLVGDNLNLFDPYNQINAQAGLPFYNVLGNHDLNYMAKDDRHSDETFERTFGPSTYAFQHARVHFIILNNVWWPGFHGYRKDGWPKRGGYEGRIRDEHLQFIENYVAGVPEDEAIIVCTHIPMVHRLPDVETYSTPQFPRLLEILSTHPHTASFSAHTHTNYNRVFGSDAGYRTTQGTVHLHHNVGTTSGSWYRGPLDENGLPFGTMSDGTPRGYAVASFDGPHMSVHFQPFNRPADHQMRIHIPDVVDRRTQSTEVQVNVFNGSSESVTRMRVRGHGSWITMRQVVRTDPQYVALHERTAKTDRTMPSPTKTDHHWVAALPERLPVGVHTVEVETTDRYGQTFTGLRPMRVVDVDSGWDTLDEHSIRNPRTEP